MRSSHRTALAIAALITVVAGVVLALRWTGCPCSRTIARTPAPDGESAPPATAPAAPPPVVRLAGSPEEIGTQHGRKLVAGIRTMIREYVAGDLENGRLKAGVLARVRRMKPSLPGWFRRELAACAGAAGVDEDVLLYAQCEGDIKSLGGCTTYVAFGPATAGGAIEIGRNFDYWGLESTERCARVFVTIPRAGDGHAFVSVGWSGILGGWTFYNEKGLFVANNLGGFSERDPRGIPTLILERIVAQKAATLEEAISLVKKLPRMRGQALIVGHAGDPASRTGPSAALLEYDGARVEVTPAARGLAFHSSMGRTPGLVLNVLRRAGRKPYEAIRAAGGSITLHSVAVRPGEGRIWVAHGARSSAHLNDYVPYDLAKLFRRDP